MPFTMREPHMPMNPENFQPMRQGLSPSQSGRTLAIGFSTAVAMWTVGYVSMMAPGLVVGELLFALTLACIIAGGIIAGRNAIAAESPRTVGLKVGLVTGLVNLLLIGSLAGGKMGQAQALAMWAAGDLLMSMALGAIGGAIGARRGLSPAPPQPWFFRFTCVAAATVFLLLITGGLVTGLEAGLAVPDWPNSFGHNMLLYPLSEMIGGIYYEHAHRLYGMLVGVTAITLAVSVFIFDRRGWLRSLVVAYLLMVCVQGVLGGTRVIQQNTALAIAHGVFGQIVFGTIVLIAAFTSPTWSSDRPPMETRGAKTDRTWTAALVIMMIGQLILGAMYRHLLHVHILYTHILWATLVTGVLIFAAGRAWSINRDVPVLPRVGRAMLHTVGLQIALGVVAMIAVWSRPVESTHIPVWEVVVTTAHQATGAVLLAMSVLLMAWTRRLLRAASTH
jgi:cytochrome c oxidase assembly protein subunit 15